MMNLRAAVNYLYTYATIFTVFVLLLNISPVHATDLRGKIEGRNAYTPQSFPVGGAKVDIWQWNGKSWNLAFTYVTGYDGMYYIQNMMPGSYNIQINGTSYFYPLVVYPIPRQDIPPIFLQY